MISKYYAVFARMAGARVAFAHLDSIFGSFLNIFALFRIKSIATIWSVSVPRLSYIFLLAGEADLGFIVIVIDWFFITWFVWSEVQVLEVFCYIMGLVVIYVWDLIFWSFRASAASSWSRRWLKVLFCNSLRFSHF